MGLLDSEFSDFALAPIITGRCRVRQYCRPAFLVEPLSIHLPDSIGLDYSAPVLDDLPSFAYPTFPDCCPPCYTKIPISPRVSYSAKETICRALALITGYTKLIKKRSLLSGRDDYVTIVLERENRFRDMDDVWYYLRKKYSDYVVDSVKELKFLSHLKGVIFDLPIKYKKIFFDVSGEEEEI